MKLKLAIFFLFLLMLSSSISSIFSLPVAGQSCVDNYKDSSEKEKLADVSKCPDLLKNSEFAKKYFDENPKKISDITYRNYAETYLKNLANGAPVTISTGVEYFNGELINGESRIILSQFNSDFSIEALDGGGFSITYRGKAGANGKTIKINGIDTRISGNAKFYGDKIVVRKGSSYERIEGNDFIRITAISDTVVINGDDLKISQRMSGKNRIWNIDVAKESRAQWAARIGKIGATGAEQTMLYVARFADKDGNLKILYNVNNVLVPGAGVDFGLNINIEGTAPIVLSPSKLSKGELFVGIYDSSGNQVIRLVPQPVGGKRVLEARDGEGKLLYTIKLKEDGKTYFFEYPSGRISDAYKIDDIEQIMTRNFGLAAGRQFKDALIQAFSEKRLKNIDINKPETAGIVKYGAKYSSELKHHPTKKDDFQAVYESFQKAGYEKFFEEASKKYDVDKYLLMSIAAQESSGDPSATSYDSKGNPAGFGLMQVENPSGKGGPCTAGNIYDPQTNINCGAYYISSMIKKFDGNVVNAVAAYNAGPETVKYYGGVPPYKVTRKYVPAVLSYYKPKFERASKKGIAVNNMLVEK